MLPVRERNSIGRIGDWQWRPCGVPWIDPLKEVNAYQIAISNGLMSRREAKNLMGCTEQSWQQTFRELAEEEKAAADASITLQVAMPGAVTTRDEEGQDNPANETAQDRGTGE